MVAGAHVAALSNPGWPRSSRGCRNIDHLTFLLNRRCSHAVRPSCQRAGIGRRRPSAGRRSLRARRADSVAPRRGARARAAFLRKTGAQGCKRQHRCKRDRRTHGSQSFHCCSLPLLTTPVSIAAPCQASVASLQPPDTDRARGTWERSRATSTGCASLLAEIA